MPEVLTRILLTFITKCNRVILESLASFFQKRTFLIPRTTTFTGGQTDPFAFQVLLHREVPATNVTVHPAGRDKV
jgi:hypothetical protein